MRILLVEDDALIARDVETALKNAGFLVDRVEDGEEAWFKGDVEDYDGVVLDLGLPKLDGLTILKRWREAGRGFPILILTARGNWTDRVEGIEAGADDYLPKPFRMEELLARLRAIMRRSMGQSNPLVTAGHVTIDTRRMEVAVNGEPVKLSPQEYRLVTYLAHNAGRAVSQSELLDHLYDGDGDFTTNSVEVLVGRVRRKLGNGCIETRRGYGYVMKKEPA
jgi:DNA-binding response OmpR family regulator